MSDRPRRQIDMIGLGAQKCGSTSLWGFLQQQPWFAGSVIKETNYFGREHDRGPDWYDGLFPPPGDGRLTGEVTPEYLHSQEAAARIRRHSPDARLFVILRDPVVRFASNMEMARRVGRVPRTATVLDLLTADTGRARRELFLNVGTYVDHLERFAQHFPREQLLVQFLEEVVEDPERHLTDLAAHVAPGRTVAPPLVLPRWNTSFTPLSLRLDRAICRVRDAARDRGRLGPVGAAEQLRRWLSRPAPESASLVDATSRALLADHFRPHNARLANFLGRDLPAAWTT